MSFKSTALIARQSIRARFGRLIAISIAILVGVAFVVGSFVLADSLRKTFDDLFTQISENVDLEVRSPLAFGDGQRRRPARPDPGRRSPTRSRRSTASRRPSRSLQRYAQLVDQDGEAVTTQGAPTFGVGLDRRRRRCPGWRSRARARPPSGPTRWPSTRRPPTARTSRSATRSGASPTPARHEFTITALVGLGDSDGFAGATLAAWDVADGAAGPRAPATSSTASTSPSTRAPTPATVQTRIEEILPDRHRGRHPRRADRGEQGRTSTRSSAPFGNGLLGVRLRHRLRQRLPDQQRVRRSRSASGCASWRCCGPSAPTAARCGG